MRYVWRGIGIRNAMGAGRLTLALLFLAMVMVAWLTRDALAQEADPTAPFDLVGTVVDGETGAPLSGAFVSLTGSDWTALSTEGGLFRIPGVRPGRLALTVETLGYRTLHWEGDVAPGVAVALRVVPEPVVLEGLKVVTDRFRARRNATATPVLAFQREALARATQESVLDFVRLRAGLHRTRCRGGALNDVCFFVRGRPAQATVYVDEMPVLGGLDYLAHLQPWELYMVEVYGQGRHIRAYTTQFMERAAKRRLRPVALLF